MGYDKEAVGTYHGQLKDMKIRFLKPDTENNIPDYSSIIKEQAAKLDKSVNEYILDLIEADIRSNPDGLMQPDFQIIKGKRAL